jgi:hypothetical protein
MDGAMTKDAKGHGSYASTSMGHEEHWEHAKRQYALAAMHEKAGDRRAATDARAAGHEHAAQAKHLLIRDHRRAAGLTPAQKMAPRNT